MEVIDIGVDSEPITFSLHDHNKPSVNFGPGIELLMNDKKKSASYSTSIDVGDLDNLENELNELTGGDDVKTIGGGGGGVSGFFGGFGGFGGGSPPAATTQGTTQYATQGTTQDTDSHLGQATAHSVSGMNHTSDGFSRLNTEVPLEYAGNKMTDRDRRRKKRMMIKKLEEWTDKGIVKNATHFDLESNYDEIEDEYEGALEDKRRKDSIKIQGWWFMTLVNSVEYANAAFNPFDLNLDGWGEQVSEDLDSYDDIFGELYQKYKGGKLSPEISILLRLGFSAAVVNFTNKALSTSTPAFNDVIKQSPELMKMFTNATVQSMNQASPGFNFASQMMNREPEVNQSFGPPPAPIQTKNQTTPVSRTQTAPMSQMQFTPRPDIAAGRGQSAAMNSPMFREQGVDMQQQSRSLASQAPAPRPEMRGPQNMDIDHILAGLKTREVVMPSREVNIQEGYQMNMDDGGVSSSYNNILNENDSVFSVGSIGDMQNANMPKRTRRKQRSDKNTISLDI